MDVITTALDALKPKAREDFYVKLLTYTGPPPDDGSYRDWAKAVESGTQTLFPTWDEVDVLDCTIQFRHWCRKMSGTSKKRKALLNRLVNKLGIGK